MSNINKYGAQRANYSAGQDLLDASGNSIATRNSRSVMGDVEALKKQIEEYKEAEEAAKSPGELPIRSGTDFDDATRNFRTQIEALQNNITFVERCKDFYNGMAFKPGDAAFHKVHGNILVKGILLNQADLNLSRYVIITQEGQLRVPANDLLPISEATKVLFGKNK